MTELNKPSLRHQIQTPKLKSNSIQTQKSPESNTTVTQFKLYWLLMIIGQHRVAYLCKENEPDTHFEGNRLDALKYYDLLCLCKRRARGLHAETPNKREISYFIVLHFI